MKMIIMMKSYLCSAYLFSVKRILNDYFFIENIFLGRYLEENVDQTHQHISFINFIIVIFITNFRVIFININNGTHQGDW